MDANGPQAGLVTWAATYHAWGAVREEYDPHGIGQDIRFQGQQLDAETELHYNRFRYYDPRASQYVTQDPVGLNGGLNYYAYATGNPIKYVDPTGQFAMLLPLIPAITGTDLLIGAGLGGALIGLDKIFNRPGKTPNTGEPALVMSILVVAKSENTEVMASQNTISIGIMTMDKAALMGITGMGTSVTMAGLSRHGLMAELRGKIHEFY